MKKEIKEETIMQQAAAKSIMFIPVVVCICIFGPPCMPGWL